MSSLEKSLQIKLRIITKAKHTIYITNKNICCQGLILILLYFFIRYHWLCNCIGKSMQELLILY